MNNLFEFKRFVKNEYIPQELPRCFQTESLSLNYKTILGKANASNIKDSEPFSFTIYKNEKSRRLLSIPNPYHYLKLIEIIIDNQNEINKVFEKSSFSLTKPNAIQDKNDNFAFTRISKSAQDTKVINEKAYKGHNYVLKLDISSFFDSIYTHTISWILHGKEFSKTHKDDKNLLGNKIDFAVRNMNRQQTNGILVGNACSRILAEVILCHVDKLIEQRFPDVDVCRYVDDYSIYFTNNSSIGITSDIEILEYIRTNLLEYNLQLNESKTLLIKAPFTCEKQEIEQLRGLVTEDANVYLNNLVNIFNKCNDVSILKYGLKVLNFKINSSNFASIQYNLLNIWCNYPSLTNEVLDILLRFKSQIKIRDLKKNIIIKIFYKCINYKKDNELIWLLFACKQLNIHFNISEIEKVFSTENDLAILILLDIESNNTTKSYMNLKDKLAIELSKIPNIFYSSKWLLAYEIKKHNFIPTFNPVVDDFFAKLYKLNINFYDTSYSHCVEDCNINNGDFITRKEFNKFMKDILLLLNDKESKKDVDTKISELNNQIENSLSNKYF